MSANVCCAIISSSFVGMTQTDTLTAGGGNARSAGRVRLFVQFHAEPRQLNAQRRADRGGVLANAGGEYECVQPPSTAA